MKSAKKKVDGKGFGPHLAKILKKMCSIVKADYDTVDFKSEGWFRKYKWSCAQEAAFEKWFAEYVLKNREARKELCNRTYMNKTWCLKLAKEFTFMYGWSLSDYPAGVSQDPKCKTA